MVFKKLLYHCALDESSLDIGRVNPLMLTAAQKQPDSFSEIFQVKAYLEKYLKGNC